MQVKHTFLTCLISVQGKKLLAITRLTIKWNCNKILVVNKAMAQSPNCFIIGVFLNLNHIFLLLWDMHTTSSSNIEEVALLRLLPKNFWKESTKILFPRVSVSTASRLLIVVKPHEPGTVSGSPGTPSVLTGPEVLRSSPFTGQGTGARTLFLYFSQTLRDQNPEFRAGHLRPARSLKPRQDRKDSVPVAAQGKKKKGKLFSSGNCQTSETSG